MKKSAEKRSSDLLLLFAFTLSGFAALGYELLWTRLLSLTLGSETLGVLGVLAGFFGGMVVGAFYFDKPAKRHRNPVRLFIVLELCAAIYALASPHFLYWLAKVLPPLIGPAAGDNTSLPALFISIAIAGIVLLPGTICMGGTLAALVEARRRTHSEDIAGKGLGRLYAANTFGATLGILGSTYIIIPNLGLAWGSFVLSSVGAISVLVAYLWNKENSTGLEQPSSQTNENKITTDIADQPRAIYILLFGTGLVGIGLEIGAIQTLTQILENTVYTFANILAIYLLGTAIGAWSYQHIIHRYIHQARQLILLLLLMLTGSVALVMGLIKASPSIIRSVAEKGDPYAQQIFSELTLAFILFIVPTILMGALFSHLTGSVAHKGVGKAYGINTLGATIAPFVFGLGVIQTTGYRYALLLIMLCYFLLFLFYALKEKFTTTWIVGGTGISAFLLLLTPSSVDLIEKEEGWKVLARKEGLMGTVIVSELPGKTNQIWNMPILSLQVNNIFRMGGEEGFADKRAGHLSLLLNAEAKKVCFLGIGTGTTLGAVRQYNYERVDAVEIVPEVLDLIHYFDPVNEQITKAPNIKFHASDARRFMAASKEKYDIIFADLYHPGRDGAGLLYSKDHYEILKDHLSENGVVTQWIPLYQFDTTNLKVVIRTFLDVFPEVHSFTGIYNAQTPMLLLAGSKSPLFLDTDFIIRQTAPEKDAYKVIANVHDFLASYFMTRKDLEVYAGEGPLNTDIHPFVLFHVPKVSYVRKKENRYTALASLMPYRNPFPGFLIHSDTSLQQKALKTWKAADYYLKGQIEIQRQEKISVEALKYYIRAYKTDVDFAPARGALLNIAGSFPNYKKVIAAQLIERDRKRLK